jgi:hypothetical protein
MLQCIVTLQWDVYLAAELSIACLCLSAAIYAILHGFVLS